MSWNLFIVRFCYNLLIPLQIIAAIFIDKFIEPYLVLWGIDYGEAVLILLVILVILESVGIKYWILEQSRDLKELMKQNEKDI